MMAGKKPSNLESLFGFVLRTRQYLVGRDNLKRNKRKLLFILVTEDLSENGLKFVLSNFEDIPVVQYFKMSDLEQTFNLNGVKIMGFYKTDLTRSVYEVIKIWRVNG